ncbi:MAG: 4-hydroxythreonine-4-phosphate dehydrogenase PdxA [Gemmatimonadaceae bacterium]
MTTPRLAITLGDPRGIGAEIVRKALADPRVAGACRWVVVGPSGLECAATDVVGEWHPRQSDANAGRLAGKAITRAVALCQAGEADAMVTAPIDKHEMLAELTGREVAMMLASDRLRVVLATTHVALRDVPALLTGDVIARVARVTRAGVRDAFGIAEPRIALCALNPHAGDGGRFGDEDDTVLAPAARASGLLGPFPADTVFVRAMRGEFDAVIAPYHDVGMTAIKVASFGSAVNVTLGLPFPRTSPDHGTALDIAGQGKADSSSMIEAILLAARLAHR